MSPRSVIVVEQLVKRFEPARRGPWPRAARVRLPVAAVDGVSFAVAEGSATALLGGNGAGKSTTIAMLLGVLKPTSGTVRVLGVDMVADRYRALPLVNFSSPYVDMPKSLSARENLIVYGRLYGVANVAARIKELAPALGLEPLLERATGTLSAGEVTRLSLAKALLNRPRLLLLDEPTASLDPDSGDWVRGLLESYRREEGATLLIASHNMAEVERLCDRVLMMRAGKIVDDGSPAELIRRYGRHTLEEVFLAIAREGTRPIQAAGSAA
ncbi:MAG: ABC transporter ATP-binding protein [Rhodospirillales bacterium]|nr:ABC transporter ATP-binding protein [Rhodospirillales bacterium]